MVIHAGDCTGRGTTREIVEFCEWFGNLPHKYKILIPGNHDWGFEKDRKKHQKIAEDNGIIFLHDSEIIIEDIKIYGSGHTPEFCNWAFNCWRTMDEVKYNGRYGPKYDYIGTHWRKIPKDTDVLITHGPPKWILDDCGENVGCEELRKKVMEINPKFHIFGHIHESRGTLHKDWSDPEIEHLDTFFINASSLNGSYYPIQQVADVYDFETQKVVF